SALPKSLATYVAVVLLPRCTPVHAGAPKSLTSDCSAERSAATSGTASRPRWPRYTSVFLHAARASSQVLPPASVVWSTNVFVVLTQMFKFQAHSAAPFW